MTSILEKLHLVESDVPVPQAEAIPTSMPAMTPFPQQIAALSQPTTALTAEDLEQAKAIEAKIYATPSAFTVFQKFREAMGNSTDTAQVFRLLATARPDITPQQVSAAIDAHLGALAAKRSEFDAQIAQASKDRLDAPQHEIAGLAAEKAQITARLSAIDSRTTDLTAAVETGSRAIADGRARFTAIEAQLSAPLLQAKHLLGGSA